MKCSCGQKSIFDKRLCLDCNERLRGYLLRTPVELDYADAVMITSPALDINQSIAAAVCSYRAVLTSWAMVVAEEGERSPVIDRALSTASGQCALILSAQRRHTKDMRPTQPEWIGDCAAEIIAVFRRLTTATRCDTVTET
jgi:hypothetical protein